MMNLKQLYKKYSNKIISKIKRIRNEIRIHLLLNYQIYNIIVLIIIQVLLHKDQQQKKKKEDKQEIKKIMEDWKQRNADMKTTENKTVKQKKEEYVNKIKKENENKTDAEIY